MSNFGTALLIFSITLNSVNFTEPGSWGIPDICLQLPPRSEGICTIEIEGYYFDAQSNICEKYTVGGCRLSGGQSFGSLQDCLATCVHATRRIQDIKQE